MRVVVRGGVTGAGIALDGATRSLRTGIVEAQDWAGGTSQWSSKLVHGGPRDLHQLNFVLVAEALKERGLLLTRTAPHLVEAQPFLWPLKTRWSSVPTAPWRGHVRHTRPARWRRAQRRSGPEALHQGLRPHPLPEHP